VPGPLDDGRDFHPEARCTNSIARVGDHVTQQLAPVPLEGADPSADGQFPILGIDHIAVYAGNARQAAWTYERLGFTIDAYAGLETGQRDRTSWLLRQGDVRLVVTGALDAGSPIAEHVHRHGDGVADLAFTVPDAVSAFEKAVTRGARPVAEPRRLVDDDGEAVLATVAGYGAVVHSLVERSGYRGGFLPGFRPPPPVGTPGGASPVGVIAIDHVVAAVPAGRGDELVAFYRDTFGFRQLHYFDDTQIATEYSALMNKVMADGSDRIKLPIVEPGRGTRRSQVQEFLDYHGGPGVQHIALQTRDIVASVEELRRRGMQFLHTPGSYFDAVPDRVADVVDRLPALRRNGILADRDDEGYLLQIFARSLHDRPTLFFELIERHGAIGFGEGNIKALYEALEREQAARGNL
jgi:4-hydroxyphenylpyruvate dioxygenase